MTSRTSTRPRLLAPLLAGALLLTGCQTVPTQLEGAPQSTNELADLHTKLGIGYLREGKLELAWTRLKRALEFDPSYSTANNAMGLVYEQLGEPAKAEEHYLRAVESNPSDSAAQNNYGRYLCAIGRYQEAEQRFLQAVKNSLYETPEVAYANAGVCARSEGDIDKAEAYLRTALERNPRLPTALLAMAEVSYERKRYLSSRAYLQRFLEVGRHNSQSLWLGIRVERELGDKNAESSYAMLLKSSFPDSRETQLLESGQ